MVTVVIGARGNVGRHVAVGLLGAGERVRVTSRNPGAADFSSRWDVAAADLERPETLPSALAGAEKVFVYAKPDGVDGFVSAAKEAGVRHVVLLSSAAVILPGADRNPIAQAHRVVESAIEESGLDWTFIRPGMFATNTVWWWSRSIRDEGVVRLPYPDAQTAPIHEKDMAALAVTALTEPGHVGQAYTVYGAASLTLRDQVTQIGQAIGRKVAIKAITPEQTREELGRTMPPIGVETIMRMWTAANGTPATVSTIVEDVTGRRARTFAEWAIDHAGDFR
jgi:uncharacterized protein YbjT (DUF2867 family)